MRWLCPSSNNIYASKANALTYYPEEEEEEEEGKQDIVSNYSIYTANKKM